MTIPQIMPAMTKSTAAWKHSEDAFIVLSPQLYSEYPSPCAASVRAEWVEINIRLRVVASRNLLRLTVSQARAREICFLRLRRKERFDLVGGIRRAVNAREQCRLFLRFAAEGRRGQHLLGRSSHGVRTCVPAQRPAGAPFLDRGSDEWLVAGQSRNDHHGNAMAHGAHRRAVA